MNNKKIKEKYMYRAVDPLAIVGTQRGVYTVIDYIGVENDRIHMYRAYCNKCGNTRIISRQSLREDAQCKCDHPARLIPRNIKIVKRDNDYEVTIDNRIYTIAARIIERMLQRFNDEPRLTTYVIEKTDHNPELIMKREYIGV